MRAPMIHAAAARKRGGQPERRKMSLVATWSGATIAKSRSRPAIRRTARAFRRTPSALAIERHSVQLHPVVDEAEAEFLGDPFLKHLELVVDELDDVASFDVDQMVVV